MSAITGIHISSDGFNNITSQILQVPEYRMQPGVMFGPRSFFVDRAIPEVEVIQLAKKTVPSGGVAWFKSDHAVMIAPKPSRRQLLRDRLRGRHIPKIQPLEGNLGLDCRNLSPQNWSHFLNIHVPLAFALQSELGLPQGGLTQSYLRIFPATFAPQPICWGYQFRLPMHQ